MNYRIRAAGKTLELYIYDFIGEWLGGISPKQIADDLKAAGKIDLINVRINSPGGDVFDGITIYNLLKRHQARVEVDIDGLAASIASIVAMAGDSVRMAANGMFMVHEPMSGQFGNADDMRKKADLLDQVQENLISTYAAKTGISDARLAELMAAETWMTAAQAAQEGFVDAVTAELKMAACFDLSRFKNAPRQRGSEPRANEFRARLAANADRVRKICGVSPQ